MMQVWSAALTREDSGEVGPRGVHGGWDSWEEELDLDTGLGWGERDGKHVETAAAEINAVRRDLEHDPCAACGKKGGE